MLAAVDCYWRTIVEANDPPTPDHPGFAECFTGPALERSQGNTRERLARGERVQDATGPGVEDRSVASIDAGAARVIDCVVDDAVVLAADGSVIDGEVYRLVVDVRLDRQESGWKVASIQTIGSYGRDGVLCPA